MEKKIITTGKTIDLAVEAALAQLGLTRDDISYEVLALPKSGFLGFGAQPAKVQVTYEVPDPVVVPEKPKSALGSASRSKPKAKPPVEKKPEAPKAEAPKAEKKAEPVKEEAPKTEKPKAPKAEKKVEKTEKKVEKKAEKAEKKTEKKVAAPKTYAAAEAGSVEEKIEIFIAGLLEKMGSDAVPHAWKENENTYKVDLVGEDLGYLIGRRGDTLDAIQHLSNYAVNRDVEGRIRINVDS